MNRAYYTASISDFLIAPPRHVLDSLAGAAGEAGFAPREGQLLAWRDQIAYLQRTLQGLDGWVFFEYSIPRMGRRIDVVLLIGPVIFVVEFKVGESRFDLASMDQVWDYGLDLKNFHEASHHQYVAPVLVVTEAPDPGPQVPEAHSDDKLLNPIKANLQTFPAVIRAVLDVTAGQDVERDSWIEGRYRPTPTIIEAVMALYRNHSVADITRSDAEAAHLAKTSETLTEIIQGAQEKSRKVICFVTGVPGAGKTLVGLNVATENSDRSAVYLSGNGPLVKILCEALARDQVLRSKEMSKVLRKTEARSRVKAFIQNVHHFRDECLKDHGPPVEHIAIFDEAQRAWTKEKTADFMKRKKGKPDFGQSEPEYLISCLDRHSDWAAVICLVGGGQEIHTGEAGIGEWVESLERSYPSWQVYVSSRLTDAEYGAGAPLKTLQGRRGVHLRPELHLATSMRSFRAENVSQLVKQVLDLDVAGAQASRKAAPRYPIVLTRELEAAKRWLRQQARGSERYGIVVSSQAERLKPHAISVKTPVDPVHWFLDDKDDVRSSYYLEDVATEFHVQGLELDWTCVTWDADLRHDGAGWQHWSFQGKRWNRIRKSDRQRYLKNAYRVLLTRARQGMVIVVPQGDPRDPTRSAEYYDPTFRYLASIGFPLI